MLRVASPGVLGAIAPDDQDSFKQLFELSPDPTWIIEGNRFVECNEAAIRTLDYPSRDELLNVHPTKLSPPRQPDGEDSFVKAELMMAIARDSGMHRFEWMHTKADGTDFVAEVTLSAIQLSGRQVIYCVWRDITERKKSDLALKLFRALIDQSNDAIEVIDPDTFRFLDVNQTECLALGYSREEMLSKTVFDIDPIFDRSMSMEFVQNLRKAGSMVIESRHQRKDGSVFPVELSMAYIELGRNYVLAVARDFTEREQANRQLVDSEQRFRGLVEQAIAGIYILQDGKVAYVNPRLVEIFGYASADELIGRDSISLIVEKDRSAVLDNRRRVEGEVSSLSYGFTAVRKDGSMIEVGVHSNRATHQGRPAIIGMLQDVSEKKRAEEEIRRYLEQIKTAFVSTVEVATTLSEMRDPYTAGHERRVAEIAVAIGAELGFDASRQEGLRVAGHLHDIGKMTIPAEILSKPGKLSAIEFQLIQGHAQASYDVLKGVEFPWPVAEVALQHHERIDGSGYPQRLKGEAILLEARIMAVADVVEAMSSHRPYRVGRGIEAALQEIERGRGSVYDTDVADACLKLFREKGYAIPA
jgi:PAS domain S-box-containing protein